MPLTSRRPQRATATDAMDTIRTTSRNQISKLPVYKSETWKVKIIDSRIDLKYSGYPIGDELQFKITLPPRGKNTGLTFAMDEEYLAVRLERVDPTSHVSTQLPRKCVHNSHWVVQIHNERPTTPSYAREIIK